ncbi:ribosomal protein S18-alanine N-acetyltransferase [Ahrensia sp. 13_GOM-1096m]|uniref:ribosomal protein S18-alanine N-acetyltransferase n=1 Tax=Ahrensia sp. 13_GOM-1096m TaxID=1380380 RepID=UPI00068655FE|nr:ribosomal protein S18-alanine N-acetyltransferase [Ahrensia sp. 13_GOM-1096m]
MAWPFTNRDVGRLGEESLNYEHAQALAEIHALTFPHAWTDGDFLALLNNRNVSGLLLREPLSDGGRNVGFVLVRTAADEAEILTVAVTPKWQNFGVGRRLLNRIIERLNADKIASLFLEVDENNKSAIALYKRLRFEQVAIRENYYTKAGGRKANALVMRRENV